MNVSSIGSVCPGSVPLAPPKILKTMSDSCSHESIIENLDLDDERHSFNLKGAGGVGSVDAVYHHHNTDVSIHVQVPDGV